METSYTGPTIDDPEVLAQLPQEIAQGLRMVNGFITSDRGFHVRGACHEPVWHSIRAAWEGEYAIHQLFPSVKASDIPLAEDCFGDQFLLRDGSVIRVFGETGEVEYTTLSWGQFLEKAATETIEFLQLQPLQQFQQSGGVLAPGSLLSVYPPFVAKECVNPSLRPIPALERRSALADFARQIANVQDGQTIKITIS
jgi:hypothetical protein